MKFIRNKLKLSPASEIKFSKYKKTVSGFDTVGFYLKEKLSELFFIKFLQQGTKSFLD